MRKVPETINRCFSCIEQSCSLIGSQSQGGVLGIPEAGLRWRGRRVGGNQQFRGCTGLGLQKARPQLRPGTIPEQAAFLKDKGCIFSCIGRITAVILWGDSNYGDHVRKGQ